MDSTNIAGVTRFETKSWPTSDIEFSGSPTLKSIVNSMASAKPSGWRWRQDPTPPLRGPPPPKGGGETEYAARAPVSHPGHKEHFKPTTYVTHFSFFLASLPPPFFLFC